jgi:ribulose 1,5-bisphosphate synthetase/thiazole synthase
MKAKKYDVTIVGGGHNGLVAATYLAKAGKSVVILEANPEIGGATSFTKIYLCHFVKMVRLLRGVSKPMTLASLFVEQGLSVAGE